MHMVVCSDAFKDAASAPAVCEAIARGIRQVQPMATLDLCPLSDGGEGTARLLSDQLEATWVEVEVLDPLQRIRTAGFGWLPTARLALLDMAEASGLQHLSPGERNPLHTTTYGTGQLIKAALEKGATNLYLGIGGSATNDGGTGMAAALGYHFWNGTQKIHIPTGADLHHMTSFSAEDRHPLLAKAGIQVLCDVRNSLTGPEGAAHIYAPQKGATAQQVAQLDEGLQHLDRLWQQHFGRSFATVPGGGAAGGLGAGLLAFCQAKLVSGADTLFRLLNIAQRLDAADVVFSGEGSLDQQSLSGKLIGQLSGLVRARQLPLIILCGQQQLSLSTLRRQGILAALPINSGPCTLSEALPQTLSNLSRTAAMATALFCASAPRK